MEKNKLLAAAALVVVTVFCPKLNGEAPPHPATSSNSSTKPGEEISWRKSYEEARREGQSTQMPILVDFGATWCGWCRTMDAETYHDPAVVQALRAFVCVKVDIDADRQTAYAFAVSGVPRAVFLDPSGDVIADQQGYMPPATFKQLLNSVLERLKAGPVAPSALPPRKPGHRMEDLSDLMKMDRASVHVDEVALFIGDPDPKIRERSLAALLTFGPDAIPPVTLLLSSPYLGTRIGAESAMRKLLPDGSAATHPPFDAWEDPTVRRTDCEAWRKWLSERFRTEFPDESLKQALEKAIPLCNFAQPPGPEISAQDRNGDGRPDLWNISTNAAARVTALDEDFNGTLDHIAVRMLLKPGRVALFVFKPMLPTPELLEQSIEYQPTFREDPSPSPTSSSAPATGLKP